MSRFEIKIVAALLLIAVMPLAASVVLVGQVIRVSDSVSEGQTQRLAQPLERAAQAYRALFAARKRIFHLQGQLLAADAELHRALSPFAPSLLEARLRQLVQAADELARLEVLDRAGRVLRTARRKPAGDTPSRRLELAFPLGASPYRLRVMFLTPEQPFEDFRRLGLARNATSAINQLRGELATYYRVVFLIMFGAVALVATGLGLFIARRTARRVAVLAQATRKVAAGDLETRVELQTRDELGELASLFNEMVQRIKESGERISYLERIGAWQEIARRLAHEIKNPLTPIQLAVQQLHRKYKGEDAEFGRMLEDACEIITEEVDGLRRLVQAFSAFAKLPSVQPEPVELNALVEDFLKSHAELSEQAHIRWTPSVGLPVLVDRMLLKHVLFNVVENAIHAAEESGQLAQLEVTLTAHLDEQHGQAVLLVADNGPGMDRETAARAFEPYFTTKERGTGLGLAIVKKIVLEHRGSITVQSEPGAGARFVVTLPLAADAR